MRKFAPGLAALWLCVALAPAYAGDEVIYCGNGTVEPDKKEECDDGNLDAGDCCSPDCLYELKGSPCAEDENPCTDDVCDGAGKCGETNEASCDNGIFCDGADTCVAGACVHAGDPCPATDCHGCDEQ